MLHLAREEAVDRYLADSRRSVQAGEEACLRPEAEATVPSRSSEVTTGPPGS